MEKTVVVTVQRVTRHPLYGKVMKLYKKYKAHDEENAAQVGDMVRICECRPISKDKRFFVQEIVKRAEAV
jgi:small subunit ribosomal protein S17